MLILVVFGYVQLYEISSDVSGLERTLSSYTEQYQMLQSDYEGKIDLAAIEMRAVEELGLMQPTEGQTVQVNLTGEDRAEVLEVTNNSPFGEIIDAIITGVEGLLAYLS